MQKQISFAIVVLTSILLLASLANAQPQPAPYKLDRTTLPIPEPKIPHSTVFDARNAKAPPQFQVKAPAGAPNVLIVLIDDMGFGMSSAFGGPISMPTLDRLAKNGLRYNHFHTTALCSPTRIALLTGRNHHTVQHGVDHGNGHRVPRSNRAAPQQRRVRWRKCCGSTATAPGAFGKSHETAAWEVSPSGPDRSLAHALRLRQVLWLPWRRNQPMGADALRRTERRSNCPKRPAITS